MAAPHAFLDILANTQVRDAYLAGRISIILSSDLEKIVWANGAGANFLGFRTVADSIGVDSGFDNLTRLQIENGLNSKRPVKISGIPNAESFLINALAIEHLGDVVFLRSIAAAASENGFVDLTNGLSDEFTEAAVIDINGNILSATKGLGTDFVFDEELLALLRDAQAGNGIKKSLLKNYSDRPVGILELSKEPAIFLIILAKTDIGEENLDEESEDKSPFVYDNSRFPLRFSWQMDKNSLFTDVSPELSLAVGKLYSDVIDKSFNNLAKEWNMDDNGTMRALLKSHKAWARVKIYWPVQDSDNHVEIEFSALPVYLQDRTFKGYRGFGIITEAQAAAKDIGSAGLRKRAPRGLTTQEQEAFTSIARKLKADILAVELPRNLRQAQEQKKLEIANRDTDTATNIDIPQTHDQASLIDEALVLPTNGTEALVDDVSNISNDLNMGDDVASRHDIKISEKYDVQEANNPDYALVSNEETQSNEQENQTNETNEVVNLDVSIKTDATAEIEPNVSARVEDGANSDSHDSTEVLGIESIILAAVDNGQDKTLLTLDDNYRVNDEEAFDNQNSDLAIDALLNSYIKDAYDPDSLNNIIASAVTAAQLEPQEGEPKTDNSLTIEELALIAQIDEDIKAALEQEWAIDKSLIGDVDAPKTNVKDQADSEVLEREAINASLVQDEDHVDNINHKNDVKEPRDIKHDHDAEQHSNKTIVNDSAGEEEDKPLSMKDALAALRRSLEENGVEAIKPLEPEKYDGLATENNSFSTIDEIMSEITFSADSEEMSSVISLDSGDEQDYDEDTVTSKLIDKNEADISSRRLNLRPAETNQYVHASEPIEHVEIAKAIQDDELSILPSPRIEFSILQQLPLAILIYRDNRVLFTSNELLRITGFPTLDSFRAHGTLSVILREWMPRNILIGSNDEVWSVRPQMRMITWADGRDASMISFGNLEKQSFIDREDFESLQRKAVELSILLNLISDGVLILDNNGLIHSVNEAAQRMFGLDGEDIKGRNFRKFFTQESLNVIDQYFSYVTKNIEKLPFGDGREVHAIRSNGDNISLLFSLGKMELEEGYFLMLRDLSAIHAASSELLVACHQAEEEAQRKSRYLALVSHEVRTPLNAIIGLAELILEEKFGPLNNDRYRSYLRDIINSGGHISALLNDLLDAAKIAEGQKPIDICTVSLAPILKEILGLMAPQANTGRIIMRSNIAHNLPNIAVDKRSIKQIIVNLLSNAIRFTPPGGQIIVSALPHENAGVLLRVRDSGIGMNENEIEEAMVPFHQLSKSVKYNDANKRGAGLGLPLTKALADANNARFNLHSELGKGTVAEVIFPLAVNSFDDKNLKH